LQIIGEIKMDASIINGIIAAAALLGSAAGGFFTIWGTRRALLLYAAQNIRHRVRDLREQ
jgi:hypothetical protein